MTKEKVINAIRENALSPFREAFIPDVWKYLRYPDPKEFSNLLNELVKTGNYRFMSVKNWSHHRGYKKFLKDVAPILSQQARHSWAKGIDLACPGYIAWHE